MRFHAVVVLASLLAGPGPVFANPAGPSDSNAVVVDSGGPSDRTSTARTFGVAAKTFLTLSPWDFRPISSAVTYQFNNTAIGQTLSRTNATGDVWFKAPVHLPAGALVTEVEAVVCDTSASRLFASFFFVQPRGSSQTAVSGPSTTTAEAPGCVDRTVTFGTPVEINNGDNAYHVEINMGGDPSAGDSTVQFASMRIGYVLQVSPAGAQAFNDVPPSHPFFQFIQALAAAGITGGCSATPPLYCPDDPITRGQMAVFISRALGLHFAP
jgi:hypothetical protein